MLLSFEITEMNGCKIIGKSVKIDETNNAIPKFWEQVLSDGTLDIFDRELKEYIVNLANIGFMHRDLYIIGRFVACDVIAKKGYISHDIQATKIIKTRIKGEIPKIYMDAYNLSLKQLEKDGYRIDEYGFCAEVYTEDGFVIPLKEGKEEVVLDYYISIK